MNNHVKRVKIRSLCVSAQLGLTMVELLIAMALGLSLMAGGLSVYSVSANNFSNILSSSQQYESGRHSLDLLRLDLKHAGYYGGVMDSPTGAVMPDPCSTDFADLEAGLAYPVQGYETDAGSPLSCISDSDLVIGTDILVVRRGRTRPLAGAESPEAGMLYLQSNTTTIELQIGNPSGFELPKLASDNSVQTVGTKADGTPTALYRRFNNAGAAPIVPNPRVAADIRPYLVHIYFVAPCSQPAGGGDRCTGADDDFGDPIPTLKRLELNASGGRLEFSIVPLVEGLDNFQVDYGVDTDLVGAVGSGVPNIYTRVPTADQWSNIVSVKVTVLARNILQTTGYTDTKRYFLGLDGVTAPLEDNYKRHVYSTMVHITNVSGRREVPL